MPDLRWRRSALPEELAGRVRRARELVRGRQEQSPAEPPRRTSLAALDRLLPEGLPRGELTEIVGRRTSGRFSAVLTILAAATGGGEAVALVDLGNALEPRAAGAAGIVLERLLWLQPQNLKQALGAAEILLQGGFPWVIVDLGQPPIRGGRGGEAGWRRLARAAHDHRAVILISAPYRASGTAAAVVLRARRGRVCWSSFRPGNSRGGGHPPLLETVETRFELEKIRGRSPGAAGEISFDPGTPWTRSRLAATPAPSLPAAVSEPRGLPAAAGGGSL